jgi:hypothetical protein
MNREPSIDYSGYEMKYLIDYSVSVGRKRKKEATKTIFYFKTVFIFLCLVFCNFLSNLFAQTPSPNYSFHKLWNYHFDDGNPVNQLGIKSDNSGNIQKIIAVTGEFQRLIEISFSDGKKISSQDFDSDNNTHYVFVSPKGDIWRCWDKKGELTGYIEKWDGHKIDLDFNLSPAYGFITFSPNGKFALLNDTYNWALRDENGKVILHEEKTGADEVFFSNSSDSFCVIRSERTSGKRMLVFKTSGEKQFEYFAKCDRLRTKTFSEDWTATFRLDSLAKK